MFDDKQKIDLKYSKLGLKSELILLIPIFPVLTLFLMGGIAVEVGDYFSNCELGCKIVFWLSLLFAIILNCLYIVYKTYENNIHEKGKLGTFFFFHLLLYSLVNFFVFIIFLGTNDFCHGDGQIILLVYFSGPISSLIVLLNGFIIDLIIHFKLLKKKTNP